MQPVEKIFLEHIQNKDELNPPQQKIASNLYNKYFEGDWLNSYGPKKRRIAKSCAKYWVNNPPRHSKLAAKILNDPEYIQQEKSTGKFVNARRLVIFFIQKRQNLYILQVH